MATATSKRILVSESQKTIATLEVGDWKLNITYEGEAGKQVSQVTVNGNKGNAFVNFNRSAQQINVNFNGSDYDTDLIAAILIEVSDITKPV